MELFKKEFEQQKQAEKIRQSITNKNTPFEKIRKRMLKELNSN